MASTVALILAIAAAVLLALCMLPWVVRLIGKKLKPEARKRLNKAVKPLRKNHKKLAIAALVCGLAHALWIIATLHQNAFTGWLLVLLLLVMTHNAQHKRENWLHVHRTLSMVVIAVLVLHAITEIAETA